MFISNRSSLITYYTHKKDDGTGVTLSSSHGNEALFEKYADKIEDDVITNNVLNYCSYKEYESGLELHQITKLDCMGSIPDWAKTMIAGRTSNNLQMVVNYIRDGSVPAAPY